MAVRRVVDAESGVRIGIFNRESDADTNESETDATKGDTGAHGIGSAIAIEEEVVHAFSDEVIFHRSHKSDDEYADQAHASCGDLYVLHALNHGFGSL